MTARDHNNLLSIFFLIMGGIQLLAGIFIIVVYGIMGLALVSGSPDSEGQMVGGIFLILAVALGVVLLLIAAFYGFAGMKMRKHQKIGRTLGIVGSALSLPSIPLGLALGIYGLWFFLSDEGKQLYDSGMAGSAPTQPQPNSWQ